MIYREQTLKKASFKSGDICKECILIDCSNIDLAHLEKCEVITTTPEKVTKKKSKKCLPCEDKKTAIEVVDMASDANG
tara:strand:+ start:228 stop:461 length:234 start_codon:yes stop_codon:yes gene_type:complete